MNDRISIDPKTTALLAIDFQTGVVEHFAAEKDALLARTEALIAAARKASLRVIYVVVGFRPGYPEVSAGNATFSAVKSAGRFAPDDVNSAIHPRLAPEAGEVIVTKHRVGAFAGTDLDMILRANGIDTLVLCGVATSGCVLSTVRHAADADYRLLVAADCCSDTDAEVHRVLTEKVFPRQAQVTNAAALIVAL